MMMTRKKGISLLAAVMLVAPAFAQAQEIGRTLMTRGQVEARAADGSVRPLTRGAALMAGDTVLTGADGTVQLKMVDDAMLALASNTEFTFAEYEFDGTPATPDAAVMRLLRGCFRTVSGSIGSAPDDRHRIETPVATITVRGTFHTGSYDGTVLHTATYEGGTTVSNEQGALEVGSGAWYDYSRTRAALAPEGLLSAPVFAGCGELGEQVVNDNMLGSPLPPMNIVIPAEPSSAPSRPVPAPRDP